MHAASMRAEAELHALNAALEQRLGERAAQADAARRELEAFAYSVSHDLRAPLRTIDGFSKLLEDEYAASIGEEGKDALRRVRAAAAHMAELLDDLVKLSRVSRAEMNLQAVDLSALARSVADELKASAPERNVAFEIRPALVATGDRALLAMLLRQLIANAWKFTSKHPSARIEVGAAEAGGERAYFVRDDGAGFDMAAAENLFTPFQRLHGVREFPGTGIGLATVRRIVQRHGGRAWAEAAVEKGATFHFTLPPARAAA
jgi:light-regulated signal transduction histidine kinase (bacteriophytochrome)